jgi:DNA-binding CsgD family transcriptional regulator
MNTSNDENNNNEHENDNTGVAPLGIVHLAHWPDVVSPMIRAIHSEDFPRVLFECINRIAPIDSAIIMVYRPDEKPTLLYDGLHPCETHSFYECYLSGAYLLSPLYRGFQTMRSGFYRLESLEQDTFERSEFGMAYFNDSGLCDEASYLLKMSDDVAIAACFGRQQLHLPFSDVELQQLHVAEPVFRALMEKHWQEHLDKNTMDQNSDDALSSRRMHHQLQTSLRHFGLSLLTDREREVLHLMFEGKASKAAAKALNISPDTERGHRKNIYTKLNVASQAELFSLVFAVIGEIDALEGVDPLVSYREARA